MQLTGNSIETIKFFFSKIKVKYLLLFLSSIVVGVIEGITTLAIYPVIKFADTQSTGETNEILQKLINFGTDYFSTTPLKISVYFLISITLIKLVLMYGNAIFSWVVANKLVKNLRVELIDKFLKTDYQFIVNAGRGDFTFRVMNTPGFVGKCMNNFILLSVEIFKIIMVFIALLMVDKTITFIISLITITYLIINFFITKKVSYGTGSGRAKSASEQTSQALNIISGYKNIKLFGVFKFWINRFKNEVMVFYKLALKDTLISDLPKYLIELIVIIMLASIILFYTDKGFGFSGNLPSVGVFSVAILRIMPSIKNLGTLNRTIMADLPNAEAAYLALSELSSHSNDRGGESKIDEFHNFIKFDKVTFQYAGTNNPVLNELSFTINAGKFVGIVGESGSGKTTVLDLMTNLLKPQSGKITIDGHLVNDISHESFSKLIGYVGQDPFFFSGTIRENLLFGRNGFSDLDIENVLAKAEMLQFIKTKKDFLSFSLADDGLKISGGQRQRLNLARALLGNPKILILDEATSNLDVLTEERIVNTVNKLVKQENITVVFVTHRMSAIKNADKIIKLTN